MTNKKYKNPHSELKNDVIKEVAKSGLAKVWPQETGKAYTIGSVKKAVVKLKTGLSIMDFFDHLRFIAYGKVGAADITGIILKDGRRLEIEIKTGTGEQEPDQIDYGNSIARCGGIYIVARSVEQALKALKIAIENNHGGVYGS